MGRNRLHKCLTGENPVGRFGHSFIHVGNKRIVMFGGLSVPHKKTRRIKNHPTDMKWLNTDTLTWKDMNVEGPCESLKR